VIPTHENAGRVQHHREGNKRAPFQGERLIGIVFHAKDFLSQGDVAGPMEKKQGKKVQKTNRLKGTENEKNGRVRGIGNQKTRPYIEGHYLSESLI